MVKQFVAITGRLKWLGLLGLLGYLTPYAHLKLLSLFWLLCLVEIVCDWSALGQALRQLMGIPITYLSYKGKLPSKTNYQLKNSYILPFKGQWTVVNGSTEKELSHSWEIPSQRYAYDFLILDEAGKSYEEDQLSPHSYYCYGRDIIAPCDGMIIDMKDGYEDSLVDGKGSADCRAKDIRGNYILIQHPNREYSLIAHIRKNSFTVKAGDEVKQGQVLAQSGNTGNTSEPHIHFQLQAGKSFYLAAGLPVGFTHIGFQKKNSYSLFDSRPTQIGVDSVENRTYIGRGWEVENLC